ncbi:MAG: chemotaxis protein CheA [Nitrospira sp. NTP1]|nr:chemotaxis protein CheA [Nitrospira sp. NTP1]
MSDEMQEILNDFLTESNEMLEVLDQRFVTLESDPNNTDLLNEIFRAMHSMKGSAGFLGFNNLVDVAHRGENILNKLRQGEMAVNPAIISLILETIAVIKAIMADIRESGADSHVATAAIAAKLDDILNGKTIAAAPAPMEAVAPKVEAAATPVVAPQTLGEILVNDGLASKEQVLDALTAQQHQAEPKTPLGEILLQAKAITERALDQALHKQEKQPKPAEEDATIRVETKRLDSVMNLVGELVLGRNRLIKIGTQLEQQHESDPQVRVLSETLAQLNLVTTDLQLAVMKTRMLPIKKVFAKLPRMVRDLSQKLNKQVHLEMRGEETELDKSVADEIGDPLVHLVRNAIDHGIETPAERQAKGKAGEGQLTIAASQEGNSIVIRINDDGRGIQVEKIKEKALSKGLISEAELATMEHREVLNLIFLPGFSTAEKVTDVSGRGVGMDVVRTNIRKINGSVDLESEPGKGSQIIIKLPLTIAIIQALMVEVERSIFAIPLSTVIEAVRISRSEIKTINGREVLHLRDRVLPLIRLAQEFDIPTDSDRERFYVVVAALGDRRVGVVVDELRSQEEVVIKSIWDYLETVKGVSGATITGEGKVVLILDTSELVQNAQAWHNPGVAA